jgi:hypothetical protein
MSTPAPEQQPSEPKAQEGGFLYFSSGLGNLFRAAGPGPRDKQERWQDKWVDVEDYVYRKDVIEADPDFVQVTEEVAMQAFPDAFQESDGGTDLLSKFEQKAGTITPEDGEVTLTDKTRQDVLALARELLDAAGQ